MFVETHPYADHVIGALVSVATGGTGHLYFARWVEGWPKLPTTASWSRKVWTGLAYAIADVPNPNKDAANATS